MEYRNLGHSDIKVSVIGLGTMTWGDRNTEKEAFEQIDLAIDQGVNFLDCAELYPVPPKAETYSTTESIIGHWISSTNRRKDIVLATKIAGPGLSYIRNGQNLIDAKNLKLALEGSLKRLKTDYIDLYQLHWPNRPSYHFQRHWNFEPTVPDDDQNENFIEVLETLHSFITSGKIRAFGLSNESAWGLMNYNRLAEKLNLTKPVSIQNEYSLLCRIFEPDLQEASISEKCGLLAWSPLARGILSGKYLDGKLPAGSRLATDPRKERRATDACNKATRAYVDLANEHELDPCQMAIAFANSRRFTTSTLIGATSIDQLKTNIASAEVSLSEQVLKSIEQIRREFPIPY